MADHQNRKWKDRHKAADLPEWWNGVVQHHNRDGAESTEDVCEAEFGESDGERPSKGLAGPSFLVGGAPSIRGRSVELEKERRVTRPEGNGVERR